MGLFSSNKQEKLKELQEKVIGLGVDALTSFEFSLEERQSFILNTEKSIEENFDDPKNAKKKLARKTCDKISSDYPDFAERADFIKNFVTDEINEGNPIDAQMFDVIIDAIYWEHVMTPEDAEQLLKNVKAEKGVLSTADYKKIMAKIGQKYEPELLKELEAIAPENIMQWIDATKRTGKAITNKVYETAMAIKNK